MSPLRVLPTFVLFLLTASTMAQSQTRTLYFYPPDDAKWIAGRSYISDMNRAVALTLSPQTGCGWYKATFDGSNSIRYFQFWLGASGIDKIGSKGRLLADFDEDTDAIELGSFSFEDRFAALGSSNIYFVADELDPNDPNAGWHSGNVPSGITDNSRCEFKLAAFIYDTDKSVNPSFTEYSDNLGAGSDTYGYWSSGILKGLVKSTLNSSTRKLECDRCTGSPGAFGSAAEFEAAFKDYAKGDKNAKNVKLCYDMPFSQVANGNFEFDSDMMKNNSGKTVGGFFPEVLNNNATADISVVPGSSDYSDCPSCRNKRKAESFVNLTRKINPYCFERGYQTRDNYVSGTSSNQTVNPCNTSIAACCGTAYGQVQGPNRELSHFANGDWPAKTWGMTTPNTENYNGFEADWNESWRDAALNLWGDAGCGKAGASRDGTCKANGHFCAESHANFVYDPEQEFFFRGDDDIWVYINNKLVIDLGGVHMAAPGYVKLNEITPALIPGNQYPIDIFFCDRRGGMSNIRVSTNMYIAQKSSFYNDLTRTDNTMCAAITGGADCASKMSGGSGDMCGNQLIGMGYEVDFYMINRVTKDTMYLSPARGTQKRFASCTGEANDFKCFGGGIAAKNAVYTCGGRSQCKGSQEAIEKVGITGSFNVYVRLMDATTGKQIAGSKPILIDAFGAATTPITTRSLASKIKASVNAGAILLENLPANAKLELYNLQGKRIYSTNSGNSQTLKIQAQTGMYIIKVSLGSKTLLTFNRSVYE